MKPISGNASREVRSDPEDDEVFFNLWCMARGERVEGVRKCPQCARERWPLRFRLWVNA